MIWKRRSPSSSEARGVHRVDGIDRLVALLEEIPPEGPVRLLAVPGTSAGIAEPVHDGDQVVETGGVFHGEAASLTCPGANHMFWPRSGSSRGVRSGTTCGSAEN